MNSQKGTRAIADLSTVWLEGEVFERDLPSVRLGLQVVAEFAALPGDPRTGRINYVYPTLNPETRTARVRVELPNPRLSLKPGMYATFHFAAATEPVLLLYFNFKSVGESLIVMLSLPFALVGGIWTIWALGYNWSVAMAIGFIALAGVAAETGVVMLTYLDHAWAARRAGGRPTLRDLYEAVIEGAVDRVRPIMMTVTATMAGLLPILWGSGAGASVMKRIAAPMVGGMISSAMLTLLVIPAIYSLWKEREVQVLEFRGTASPQAA